jgi:signal peptidase II
MIIPGRIRWLWLTLIVVLVDRATKAWIESRSLTYFPHVVIPNWFSIILSRNPGIAFSFFSNNSSIWTRVILIVGSVLIIGLIAWLLVSGRDASAVNAAGLALLLGGAAGNLTDRIVHGAVTDFLEVWVRFLPFSLFNPWPTFNVADAGVTIGALLLLYDVIFHSQKAKQG